ncbi:MAG: ParB N-terminal domain-containing protein [Aliifodinibius sp.]|nr:ParB N-terminal domain-containing protein [Fodinibius sp.]NIV09942.1 ParB N-terminal domain-containing protein [Fodinibius sp.]NIY23472.1 ParB N-terminal domain-containing protein [Fodinibius sp.]
MIDKTKSLQRVDLKVELLIPDKDNPNMMSEKAFNLLYDNIEKMGITDPILVRPADEGMYHIVGGHHRFEVAQLMGYEEVPCTVITDKEFTSEKAKFQMIRHNVIHGEISPGKFMSLYQQYSDKYADDILQDMFGFAEEDEFKKLVKKTASTLPKEMQGEFKEAAKELKTIDGLSKLLQELFAKHGDTLPYGYMIVDFGGKDNVWLRLNKKAKKDFMVVADLCRENSKTLDSFMELVLKGIASKKIEIPLEDLADVVFAEDAEMPTLDFLDEL